MELRKANTNLNISFALPVVDGGYDLASVDEDNLDQVLSVCRLSFVRNSRDHKLKRTTNCFRIKKMR